MTESAIAREDRGKVMRESVTTIFPPFSSVFVQLHVDPRAAEPRFLTGPGLSPLVKTERWRARKREREKSKRKSAIKGGRRREKREAYLPFGISIS